MNRDGLLGLQPDQQVCFSLCICDSNMIVVSMTIVCFSANNSALRKCRNAHFLYCVLYSVVVCIVFCRYRLSNDAMLIRFVQHDALSLSQPLPSSKFALDDAEQELHAPGGGMHDAAGRSAGNLCVSHILCVPMYTKQCADEWYSGVAWVWV